MIALDLSDKIRGDTTTASQVDFTIHGFVGNVVTQLADGQLANSIGDLYTAGSAGIGVSSIVLVNTNTSAEAVNLYLTPSGGTARRLIPKNLSLRVNYSLHTDGNKVSVMDASGQVVTTFNGALTDLSDVDITAAAQGELLQFDGSNWVDFAVGTAGNPLKSGGASANVAWYTGLTMVEVASAVNRIQITNATTGEAPVLEAEGNDTNIDLHMTPKGTGRIELHRTLPSTAAQELVELEVTIDASAQVSTSSYHAMEIETTGTPAGKVIGLGTVGQVAPILQAVASPVTPDQGEFAGRKTGGGASWADGIDGIEIFEANSDEIYVGSASQFDEIEVIYGTAATKSVVPTFWYNTAADAWTQFFPLDSTDGFIQSGDITWLLSGISGSWTNNGDPGNGQTTAGYWIKIIRTRVADPGSPSPTTIKIGVITEYEWGITGKIVAKSLSIFDDGGETITGDGTDLTVASGALINLTASSDVVIPVNIGLHLGDGAEKIESDNADLTINSGGAINLTATSDVVIPTDIGLTFGTGEKIEGDDTNLTITSGAGVIFSATTVSDGTATLTSGEWDSGTTLNACVAKGTWTVSGGWTLPAFTLGDSVDVNGQYLNNVVNIVGKTTTTVNILGKRTNNDYNIVFYTPGVAEAYTDTLRLSIMGRAAEAAIAWTACNHTGLKLGGALDVAGQYVTFLERAAPGAGAANEARVYAIVGGDTFTDLSAVFQDGSIDNFATESTPDNSPLFTTPSKTKLKVELRKDHPGVVRIVAVFPDGEEFDLKHHEYHHPDKINANLGAEKPLPEDWLVEDDEQIATRLAEEEAERLAKIEESN